MTKVIFDMSISIDGFITAGGNTPEEPLGRNGLRLHEWAFQANEEELEKIPDPLSEVGAIIVGKVTYETSDWSEGGPHVPRPVFVVTHEIPDKLPAGDTYHFVPDMETAVREAKKAAGNLNVRILGGASIGQQAIRAGLADELVVHIVPVLFGEGTPLFGEWDDAQHSLRILDVINTPLATHIRYELVA